MRAIAVIKERRASHSKEFQTSSTPLQILIEFKKYVTLEYV